MEYLLEFVVSLLSEVFDGIKKKNVRKWAMTGLMSVLGMILTGIFLAGHLDALKSEDHAATMFMGIFTAAVLVALVIAIICGHRRNWKHY